MEMRTMQISIETTDTTQIEADWLVVAVDELGNFPGEFEATDSLQSQLTLMRETKDLTGKQDEVVVIFQPHGYKVARLLLVGIGDPAKASIGTVQRAFACAVRKIAEKETDRVAVVSPGEIGAVAAKQCIQAIVVACCVASVGQDIYCESKSTHPIETLALVADNPGPELTEAANRGSIIGDAVNLTREVVNRAPHDIYPASFAQRAQQVASDTGLTCRVLDEGQLADERMNSMLAVARGSDQPPRLVILEYRGGGNGPVLGLVGKGVTFDSGGLSIKTNDGMKTMKCDMAGAGTVLGVMSAIAQLKLPLNVNGYMGLVENMLGGNAYKTGDVLTARNGKTIEVLNTDAEGRLVLADVLAYAVDEGVSHLIDLATLTGACVVALGEEITGAFTNNQEWCDQLVASATGACEYVWQMPMHDHFAELLKGTVSDIKNVGPRWGGAVTAAKFLENFVGETPWIHLDIAGPSFAASTTAWRDGGATGCMVKTLIELAEQFPTDV
jgi:leucyl aminopeptidase